MDNEILHAILEHFVQLKKDITGVKADINAVRAGQEELKNDVRAVKNDTVKNRCLGDEGKRQPRRTEIGNKCL